MVLYYELNFVWGSWFVLLSPSRAQHAFRNLEGGNQLQQRC